MINSNIINTYYLYYYCDHHKINNQFKYNIISELYIIHIREYLAEKIYTISKYTYVCIDVKYFLSLKLNWFNYFLSF